MALPVDGLEVGDGELDVMLGGIERFVTEDFLNTADIGPVLDQMRGGGVPE